MTEILLKVDDSVFEQIIGMFGICQGVEVVSTSKVVETKALVDQCFAAAIRELREDNVFKRPGDYTYIILGANQNLIKGVGYFYSPLEFLNYLKQLGFDGLPGRNTIYDGITRTFGKFPDWTFADNPKQGEIIRRRNVLSRFLSAYNKARLRLSDGFSDSL